MPHQIVIDGERRTLSDVVEIGRAADGPLLRLHRLPNGDAVVIAAGEAMRDGVPLLGNLGIVRWGMGAVLRTERLGIEIVWDASGEQRVVESGRRCRVCFGTFADGEAIVACRCESVFHLDCDRARLDCPGCGSPREVDR